MNPELMQVRRVMVEAAAEISCRYNGSPAAPAVHEAIEALIVRLDEAFWVGHPRQTDGT